jgi:type IV secretion system protein VirD4
MKTVLHGKIAVLVLATLATLVVAEVVASYVFLWGVRLVADAAPFYSLYPSPFTAWIDYLAYTGTDGQGVRAWIAISGAVGALMLVLFVVAVVRIAMRQRRLDRSFWTGAIRPVERGATDNHGHADWMAMTDVLQRFPGPHPVHGGIVIGEAYRVDQDPVASRCRFDKDNPDTWGQGGKAPLIIESCQEGSGHGISFAGSGSFKTMTMVSTSLHWKTSSVIMDPSREIGPMTAKARRLMGHKVIEMNLLNPESGCNVLRWIDPTRSGAGSDVLSVTAWICGDEKERGQNAIFDSAGRNLVACLLAHMLWNENIPRRDRTLQLFVEGVRQPADQMRFVLHQISQTSRSTLARRLADTLRGLPDITFGGACFNAYTFCSWLFIDEYARFLSADGFDPEDIVNGRTDVMIQIPLDVLRNTPALATVVMGAMMNAVFKADGEVRGIVLFDIDEASQIGAMKALEIARDEARKYRIAMRLWYQSEGQMEKIWGKDGVRPWFDSVSYRTYAGVSDPATAQSLERQFGSHGAMAYSEGENKGRSRNFGSAHTTSTGRNENRHEISRPLIRASEILQDLRADEVLIVPKSGRPIRCGAAIYFRRPEMVTRIESSRFFRRAA